MTPSEPIELQAEPAERKPAAARLAACLADTHGLALAASLLFARIVRFDAADPFWPDRDRLVFGHSATTLAARLAELTGSEADLGAFVAPPMPGAAMTTAVGLALAERHLAGRFGHSLVDHRCWVLLSATELAAGPSLHAAALAGQWQLGRLAALCDLPRDPAIVAVLAAAGWSVRRVVAGDAPALAAALSAAERARKPTLVALEGPSLASVTDATNLTHARAGWSAIGRRGAGIRRAWLKRLTRHAARAEFERAQARRLPPHALSPFESDPPPLAATGPLLRELFSRLMSALPDLASLPTEADGPKIPAYGGHATAMAACLNGLALHGGARPIGLGELQDSHAIGPTLRLASRHHWPVIHMLVEPTEHCPAAGQRAALRSIQNVTVFRPAEACEALACGELALRAATSPSVLLLSDTPQPRLSAKIPRAGCAQGAYVVREPAGPRDLTLIASGPELAIALAAEADLRADGLACAVVSLPCWDFFSAQPRLTRARILGQALRVGIETGSGFGWERWLGEDGVFVGSEACAQGIPVTAAMVAAAARRGLRGRIATA